MSPSRRVLDARGLACPQPVILTRKALAEGGFTELEVIVNTSSGRENVARFATHAGCTIATIEESGEETRIVIQPPVPNSCDVISEESVGNVTMPVAGPGIETVFLSSRTIGRGDDELGALLMRAFLYTLTESETVPRRVLLMNSGVMLAAEGSHHLENLRRLVDLGVEILACGTCLEYYKLTDHLAVGRVSNMQEIAELLVQGQALCL
ncbi:MAG: sulfurtransferase-like selenium metabolism protein YedF [Acidimicrobiales bacterium]|jgi:selenium metabolism protein YedF